MMASEETRRELYELLCTHLDQRTATLVLEVTVPANVELATRGDLQELRAELLLRFAQVEGRMVEMDARLSQQLAELDRKIDDVNTSLDKKIDDVKNAVIRLDTKVAGLDTKLTGRLYKVVIPVLASWNLLVVAVAAWLVTLTG